ncbi:competence protein CoiA family protein, partial [Nonomuraea thailandensis]
MPFTAVHPDAGRVDATQPDLGCGMDWARIYRVRPRVPLTCPECGWGVHAKHSPQQVRFFCHDPGRPPECELSNESWEHHMLKLEMAGAIRSAGWYAELEVAAEDGSWRADVMASSADGGRRMAWEAQLSPITDEDIRARTARYRAEGIPVCWVSPHKRPPNWIDVVPAVRVRVPEEQGEPWVVDDGLAGFDYAAGGWKFREEELGRFVRWVLLGQLVPARSLPRYRQVMRRVDGEMWWLRRNRWWTSPQSVRSQDEHEQMRQRQEKERQEREARRKERQAVSERRRQRLQELQQRRRAQEAERRRVEQEKAHQARMEQLLREQEEQRRRLEEQRAREAAEQEEKARRALETARNWWLRVSSAQRAELFAAVADRARREEKLFVEIPE